jgi:hypothetical protein
MSAALKKKGNTEYNDLKYSNYTASLIIQFQTRLLR